MMNEISPRPNGARDDAGRTTTWPWILASACVVIVLVALLLPRPSANTPDPRAQTAGARSASAFGSSAERSGRSPRHFSANDPARTPEEIVASKLTQFGQSRRKLVHAIAKHFKVEVPGEVEKFFDAVEGGKWEEI